jgi:hypothetical protein
MHYELMELTTGNLVGTYDTERDALRDVIQAVSQYGPSAAETLALGTDDYPRSPGVLIAQGAQLIERANAVVGLAKAIAYPQIGDLPISSNTPADVVAPSPQASRPKAVANSSGSGVYRNDFVTGTQRVAAKSKHKPVGKREQIGTGSAARYVRRDAKGHFTSDQVDVGRSLAADRRQKAKNSAPKGMKDRGD